MPEKKGVILFKDVDRQIEGAELKFDAGFGSRRRGGVILNGTTVIPTPIDIPNRGPVGGEEIPVPIALIHNEWL